MRFDLAHAALSMANRSDIVVAMDRVVLGRILAVVAEILRVVEELFESFVGLSKMSSRACLAGGA